MEAYAILDMATFQELTTKSNPQKQKPYPRDGKDLGPFEFRTKIVWFNALGFLAMHLIGLYGIGWGFVKFFQLQFASILWTAVLVFAGGEGITMGAHRLWTHRSYKATPALELALLFLQTLAGENCLYVWVRDHRQHHKYSDTDADPHNASRGFFFSHMGWLMMKKHPDVIKMGKTVDMSDLEANSWVMFQKKWYKPLYTLIALILPICVPIYLWNEDPVYSIIMNFFTRTVVLLNITWTVNSFAHIYGYRPYDKGILPVESFFVSFITLGEGWHNYHHSFPWDYKASEFCTGYNSTRLFIEYLHNKGWAYDLRVAHEDIVNMRVQKRGDGTHLLPHPQATLTADNDRRIDEEAKLMAAAQTKIDWTTLKSYALENQRSTVEMFDVFDYKNASLKGSQAKQRKPIISFG